MNAPKLRTSDVIHDDIVRSTDVCTSQTNGARTQNPNKERSATAMDRHVGLRIRERRAEIGLSQERLAEAISVSFQQIQKYEGGVNRIGASRLFIIAQALSVPVPYFFKPLGTKLDAVDDTASGTTRDTLDATPISDALSDEIVKEMLKTFSKIRDHHLRGKIVEMLEVYSEVTQRDQKRRRRDDR